VGILPGAHGSVTPWGSIVQKTSNLVPQDLGRPGFVDHERLEHPWPLSDDAWRALSSDGALGLSLLRLFIHSAAWMVRRVERVEFLDDRTVRRKVSLDYAVPHGGPVLRRSDGTLVRVLPLALMRRKTLINFDLRNHDGQALSLPGLRENQALTLAIVRAWAAIARGMPGSEFNGAPVELPGQLDRALDGLVAGDQSELYDAYMKLEARHDTDPEFAALTRDKCFRNVVDRIADSFLLLGFEEASAGSRRVVKLSYDEPLTLRYSAPGYRPGEFDDDPDEPAPTYRLGTPMGWWKSIPRRAGLGRIPTVIRFPVPAAELAASYHFEVTAPPNVSIVDATLLAGRPNLHAHPNLPGHDLAWYQSPANDQRRHRRRPSYDRIRGGYPTVNLHVVDVPHGSLSRAQISLQARPDGWLATAVGAAWLATLTVAAAWFANPPKGDQGSTILISFAAAMVAVLARPDPHRMVTRLLAPVRYLAATSAACTLTGAIVLAFASRHSAHMLIGVVAVLSVIPTVLVTRSWFWSRVRLRDHGARELYRESRGRKWLVELIKALGAKLSPLRIGSRRWYERLVELLSEDQVGESPWEQHRPGSKRTHAYIRDAHVRFAEKLENAEFPFDAAVRELQFDCPAIRVESAEGTRERFAWTLDLAQDFLGRLEGRPPADAIPDASKATVPDALLSR
jgi:hypothetical protein